MLIVVGVPLSARLKERMRRGRQDDIATLRRTNQICPQQFIVVTVLREGEVSRNQE